MVISTSQVCFKNWILYAKRQAEKLALDEHLLNSSYSISFIHSTNTHGTATGHRCRVQARRCPREQEQVWPLAWQRVQTRWGSSRSWCENAQQCGFSVSEDTALCRVTDKHPGGPSPPGGLGALSASLRWRKFCPCCGHRANSRSQDKQRGK